MDSIKVVKGWVKEFVDITLLFIAVGVIVQIVFGKDVPFFSGITSNLMDFIGQLGQNGITGLIALFVIVWVFTKERVAH